MIPHLIIIIASGGVLPFFLSYFLTSVAGGFTLLIYNNRHVMVKKVKSLGGYGIFLLYLHVFKFISRTNQLSITNNYGKNMEMVRKE